MNSFEKMLKAPPKGQPQRPAPLPPQLLASIFAIMGGAAKGHLGQTIVGLPGGKAIRLIAIPFEYGEVKDGIRTFTLPEPKAGVPNAP